MASGMGALPAVAASLGLEVVVGFWFPSAADCPSCMRFASLLWRGMKPCFWYKGRYSAQISSLKSIALQPVSFLDWHAWHAGGQRFESAWLHF